MKAHPAAELFPLLNDADLAGLAADIKANGLRLPIVTHEGSILDGRNRLRACEVAGVEPRFEEFAGSDPVTYVVSVNIKRRHLDDSQRGMIGARLLPMLHEEARRRQLATLKQNSTVVPNLAPREEDTGKARDVAARLMNVSHGTIERAARVIENAVPEVVALVDEGKLAVSAADNMTRMLPADDQRVLAQRIGTGDKPKRTSRRAEGNAKDRIEGTRWMTDLRKLASAHVDACNQRLEVLKLGTIRDQAARILEIVTTAIDRRKRDV